MMKLTSLLHKAGDYSSVSWHSSKVMPGVRFAIRRISLRQRIDLNRRVKELTIKYEFLKAGDASCQLQAALSDLLVAKLYLEWGLEEVEGLSIDGRKATAGLLIAKGPEGLANEIVPLIQAESALADDERKNS
jgi:hypothetical protein